MARRNEPIPAAVGAGPPPALVRDSYARSLGTLVGLTAVIAAVGLFGERGSPNPAPIPAPPAPVAPAPTVPEVATEEPDEPEPVVVAPPPRPAPPPIDRVAVGQAEAELDAVSADRARAEARAEEASRRLAGAARQAAAEARAAKSLAFRVRDPSARVSSATARGAFLKAERDRLKGEVATLAAAPRPKAKVLSNKNPVARPASGDEHHFEVRRNRVAYIDLDRLLELVKTDARLRIRLSDAARTIDAKVGPVGAFSLQYSLGRTLPAGLDDLMIRGAINYNLRAWEVVPEFEGRGETYETTRQPISEFARTINRLSPGRSSVTLWVYPDGFALYRKLRDDLHARGFLVAARPLPEGMPVRGSPSGSLSATQ